MMRDLCKIEARGSFFKCADPVSSSVQRKEATCNFGGFALSFAAATGGEHNPADPVRDSQCSPRVAAKFCAVAASKWFFYYLVRRLRADVDARQRISGNTALHVSVLSCKSESYRCEFPESLESIDSIWTFNLRAERSLDLQT